MTFGILAAFLASLTWALGVNVYSDLVKKYTPSAINFNRALVAGPIFCVAAVIFARFQSPTQHFEWTFPPANILWLALSCISSYAVGDLLFFKSSHSPLKVTGALAIASIYPIWSALFGYLFFNQSSGAWGLLGLFLAVGGSVGVILSSKQKSDEVGLAGVGPATALALVVSIFWALNAFSIGRVVGQDSFSANGIRMGFALFFCPLFGRIFLGSGKVFMRREDFLKALPVFIFEGFGGSYFYVYGVSHTSLAMGAVLTSLAPVLSVPIYFIRHRELPGAQKMFSILVVVAGLWLLLVKR